MAMLRPIILDIEASGFGAGSYPIEIGYVDEHGKTWCSLIKPEAGLDHWDEQAAALHKISRDTLLSSGNEAVEVALHLNKALGKQVVHSDGWYQDFIWMSRLFDLANITPKFKLEDLRTVLTPFQESIWHTTKQAIVDGLQLERHRASTDALVLQLTWVKTTESELTRSIHNTTSIEKT